jgi:hypothetical protein
MMVVHSQPAEFHRLSADRLILIIRLLLQPIQEFLQLVESRLLRLVDVLHAIELVLELHQVQRFN